MQWNFDQDLAEKLMRLAFCPSASQGEWQAAALAYFRVLRARGVTADELREMLGIVQEPPEPPPDTAPFLSFGQYRDKTVRWIVLNDPGYAEWILRSVTNLAPLCAASLCVSCGSDTERRHHDRQRHDSPKERQAGLS
jgi:hypothetical protein